MALIPRPVQLPQIQGGPDFGRAIAAGLQGFNAAQSIANAAQQREAHRIQLENAQMQQAQMQQEQERVQQQRSLQDQAIASEQLLISSSPEEGIARLQAMEDQSPAAQAILQGLRGGTLSFAQAQQAASETMTGAQALGLATPLQQQELVSKKALAEIQKEERDFFRKKEIEKLKLEPKRQEQAAKREEKRAIKIEDLTGKRESAAGLLSLIQDIKSDPARQLATGRSSMFGTLVSKDAQDFEDKVKRLTASLTLDETKKLSGPLTDKDMEVLAAASSGLRLGMSEKGFLDRLGEIEQKLNQGLTRADRGLASLGVTNDRNVAGLNLRDDINRGITGASREFLSPTNIPYRIVSN